MIFLCLSHDASASGPQMAQYVSDPIEEPAGIERSTAECTLQWTGLNAVASAQSQLHVRNPGVWTLSYDERMRIEALFKSLVDKELWADAACLFASPLQPIQPRTKRGVEWSAL